MNHTHPLDLFRGKETKLDLLDGAQRRLGVWEENVRHGDGSRRRVKALLEGMAGGSVGEVSAAQKRSTGRLRRVNFERAKATMKLNASSWPAEAFGSPCHQGACYLIGLRKG